MEQNRRGINKFITTLLLGLKGGLILLIYILLPF